MTSQGTMTGKFPKFETWFRRQLFDVRGDKVSHFELRHVGSAREAKLVVSIPCEFDLDGAENFMATVMEDITAAADSDAEGFGGVQSYVIQACHGDRKGARLAFRVRADDDDSDLAGVEAPNAKGLVSQLMRHNEALMRLSTMGNSATHKALTSMVDRLAHQVDKMMSEKMEVIELVEALTSQKHERDMDAARLANRAAMVAEGLDTLKSLVPHVVNKVAGKSLLPTTDPATLALRGLVASLTPEQLDVFTPQQKLLMQGILTQFVKTVPDNGKAAHDEPQGDEPQQ